MVKNAASWSALDEANAEVKRARTLKRQASRTGSILGIRGAQLVLQGVPHVEVWPAGVEAGPSPVSHHSMQWAPAPPAFSGGSQGRAVKARSLIHAFALSVMRAESWGFALWVVLMGGAALAQ